MNVQDIITQAQMQAEEVYDDPTWIAFINAAIDDLTPICKLLETVTLAATVIASGAAAITIAGTGLANAHEFLSTYATVLAPAPLARRQLRRLTMNDNIGQGWKLTHERLYLQGLGTATSADVDVDIYKKPDQVTLLADIPEIPAQYHNLIVLYICAKSQQKEEELNDKNDFFAEYMMGKKSMALDRIWETEPQNRKYIRKARIQAMINMQTDK